MQVRAAPPIVAHRGHERLVCTRLQDREAQRGERILRNLQNQSELQSSRH